MYRENLLVHVCWNKF